MGRPRAAGFTRQAAANHGARINKEGRKRQRTRVVAEWLEAELVGMAWFSFLFFFLRVVCRVVRYGRTGGMIGCGVVGMDILPG